MEFTPHEIFRDNWADASEKLQELRDFGDAVTTTLSAQFQFASDLHTDLEIEYRPFAETYPSMLRATLITSCVAIVELELRGYLGALRDAFGLELSPREIAGSLLDRFRVYTSKVAKVKVDWYDARWDDMVAVFELRNCIVHAGGSLAEFRGKSTLIALVERHPEVISIEDQAIVVTESTTEFALTTAESFLRSIYGAATSQLPLVSSRKS